MTPNSQSSKFDAIRFHEEPISQIWDRLFVGCYYDAEKLERYNPHKISFVFNCTSEPILFHNGIETHTLGIYDGHPVAAAKFHEAMAVLDMAMMNGHTVMIHCHAGISRAPSITGAYMYKCGYRDFDGCIQAIKDKRPIVFPHHQIVNSLKKLMGVWPYGKDGIK